MNSIEIRDKVLEQGEVCDDCLGRQITFRHRGISNGVIGAALRKAEKEEDIQETIENEELKPQRKEDCFICEGIFTQEEKMLQKTLEESKKWEFEDFLIGTKVPEEIIENEEKLWTVVPPEDAEPMKRQLNREIGKSLGEELGMEPEFEEPQIVFILDFEKQEIETQVKSLFIYGRYKKLEREIPQTKWPCTHCGGKGCEKCNQTGQQYPYTVEGIVAKPLKEITDSEGTKFHGAGREDRDALMLGNGRPFVIEAVNPHKRSIDVDELQERVNSNADGKIEVMGMEKTDKEKIQEVKGKRFDKSYEVWAETKKPITQEDLDKVKEEITGETVEQRTPTRVNHRRADKIRRRKVYNVDAEKISDNEFKATIKAEAGTYIKELVSGDYGRTRPSFAEVMRNKVTPKKLNVVGIHEPDSD